MVSRLLDLAACEPTARAAPVPDDASSPAEPTVFDADPLHLFFRRDVGSGIVLYVGRVVDPG